MISATGLLKGYIIVIGIILGIVCIFAIIRRAEIKKKQEIMRRAAENARLMERERQKQEMMLRQPLNDEEINSLLQQRKICYINSTFCFLQNKIKVNPDYRRAMEVQGRWDRISVGLTELPTLMAELLRTKRHEWFLWCLADDKNCKFLWANKGDDNESCYSKISPLAVALLAKKEDCTTIIRIHNHPHTQQDGDFLLLTPSKIDLRSFANLKELFKQYELNLIDIVCSQGRFRVYAHSFCNFPKELSIDAIRAENGVSEEHNIALHRELELSRDIKIQF